MTRKASHRREAVLIARVVARWGLVAALATAACAPARDDAFLRAKSAADRAHAAGRHVEAAEAYEVTARRARTARDRGEAWYLAAATYLRAGQSARARAVYRRLLAEDPHHARAARAAFSLALVELETGERARGLASLEDVILRYPNEAVARRALELTIDAEETPGASLPWLQTLATGLASTEIDESLRYAVARAHERAGRVSEARNAYITCVDRHPYPEGRLFDDALFRASELAEQLGDYGQAVADLRRMLAARERAVLIGSYERPRYAAAQLRLARLYRDRLHDHRTARVEFHRLYAAHTTSVLRDDALWEEARLAHADGDMAAACALARTLAQEFATSRYASCTSAICAAQQPTGGECHTYIVRGDALGE